MEKFFNYADTPSSLKTKRSLFPQALRVVTAPNHDELQSIYQERSIQYAAHNKISLEKKLMKDDCDGIAYHASVWGPNLIAGARVLPLNDQIKSESESFLKWPEWFPERGRCVDVARLFILKEGKNIKTIEALFRGVAVNSLRDDKQYITGSCTKSFVNFYEKTLNAKFSPEGFSHANVGGNKHYMFYADMDEVLRLRSSVPFQRWILIWARTALIYQKHKNPQAYLTHLTLTALVALQKIVNSTLSIFNKTKKAMK